MLQEKTTKQTRKIIYVADDDRAIVDAMRYVLEAAGYEVHSAYDSSVIQKVRQRAPDLLLLDIWMSGSDGRDICRTLKTDEQTRSLPIIMISAHPDAVSIAADCGANGSIQKPFDVEDLLRAIQLATS